MASALDIAIVILYLALMIGLGYFVSKKEDMEGYFVNNRKTGFLRLVTGTVSTAIGAGAIIGTASLTYKSGVGIGLALAISVCLSWLLVSFLAKKIKAFGDKKKAITIGDFYAERYSNRTRVIAAGILAVTGFLWTAAQFVALGNLFSTLTGLSYLTGLLITAGVTIAYTSLGGLKSDLITDAVQFWIMLFVFIMLIPLGMSYIGGMEGLAKLPESHFSLFTFGGPVLFFGVIFFAIPYSVAGMDVWQRIYSAQDQAKAKKAMTVAAILTPLFYLSAILLGLIAAASFSGINGDTAVYKLMETLLGPGLLGIAMISVLAVVMSSLDTQLVTFSSIVTKDFLKANLRKDLSSKSMLWVGRLCALTAGTIALLLAIISPDIITLILYAGSISLIFAPCVLGGFFWKRATEKAALGSIIAGFASNLTLIPFLKEQAFVPSFIIASVVFVVVSLSTRHSPAENLA